VGEDVEVGGERVRVGEGTRGAWKGILTDFEEESEVVERRKMNKLFRF